MHERQKLQKDIEKLRRKHAQDRRILAREVMDTLRTTEQVERMQSQERRQDRGLNRGPHLR